MTREEATIQSLMGHIEALENTIKRQSETIKALEQEPKSNGRTIDADELLKRISEKAKLPSLSEDTVNGLCGATAIIYDMLNESGQEK